MDWDQLNQSFGKLHSIHGNPLLDPIISGGSFDHPDICFVFMNPTARNVASSPEWTSIKAPWIGTKSIWRFFNSLGLLNDSVLKKIEQRAPQDWDYTLAEEAYSNLSGNNAYITNLAKCTQPDARALSNTVFRDYLPLFEQEINLVRPQKIITFGNQVSSVVLNKNISVSKSRKAAHQLNVNRSNYPVYPVFYPVGQGHRNINEAIEDVEWILRQ